MFFDAKPLLNLIIKTKISIAPSQTKDLFELGYGRRIMVCKSMTIWYAAICRDTYSHQFLIGTILPFPIQSKFKLILRRHLPFPMKSP